MSPTAQAGRAALVALLLALGGRGALAKPAARAGAAEAKLAAAIEPLRQRYTISEARVGKGQGFNLNGEQGWSARLSSPALGPIEISIFLPTRDGTPASTEPFLREADDMVKRVRLLPWLLRYSSRARAKVTLFYLDDRSVGASTKAEIVAKMRTTQTPERREAVGAQLDRAVAIQVATGTFIVLPDGSTYVHATREPAVLKGVSAGEVVDSDGNVLP